MNLTSSITKNKEDLISIAKTTIGIILLFVIPRPDFLAKPVLGIVFISYLFFLIHNLYSRINLRRKPTDAVRFNASNDEYYRLNSMIIGCLVLIASIFSLYTNFMQHWWILVAIFGLLLLLNGCYFVPTGYLQIQNDDFIIKAGNSPKRHFFVQEIKELTFRNQSIVLTKMNDEKQSIFRLNISPQQLSSISNYLSTHAPEIKVLINQSENQ